MKWVSDFQFFFRCEFSFIIVFWCTIAVACAVKESLQCRISGRVESCIVDCVLPFLVAWLESVKIMPFALTDSVFLVFFYPLCKSLGNLLIVIEVNFYLQNPSKEVLSIKHHSWRLIIIFIEPVRCKTQLKKFSTTNGTQSLSMYLFKNKTK